MFNRILIIIGTMVVVSSIVHFFVVWFPKGSYVVSLEGAIEYLRKILMSSMMAFFAGSSAILLGFWGIGIKELLKWNLKKFIAALMLVLLGYGFILIKKGIIGIYGPNVYYYLTESLSFLPTFSICSIFWVLGSREFTAQCVWGISFFLSFPLSIFFWYYIFSLFQQFLKYSKFRK